MTASFDWSEARRRLEEAKRRVGHGGEPTPEERRRTLERRAAALAREPERDAGEAGASLHVVEFLLAPERYAVETRYVREVWPLRGFTPLPETPPFILGVVSVRGRIQSVVDIRKFFDLPAKGLTERNKVILLDDGRMDFGILADDICGVRSIPREALQESLPTLTGIRGEYLRGVTDDRVVILDAERMLSDERMVVA
jgi:purine-binding chemotaxis protein CheW